MILRSTFSLRKPSNLRIYSQRSIFVISTEKKQKSKTRKEKPKRLPSREITKKEINFEPSQDFAELRNLTASVSEYVARQTTSRFRNSNPQISDTSPQNEDQNEGALVQDHVGFENVSDTHTTSFDPKKSSLLTPAIGISASLREKIGPAVKYLVTKEHQNWGMALNQIEAAGGFEGISELDIRKLVYNIPRLQLVIVFPQIERLLSESGIQKSPKILNAYFKALIAGGTISSERLALLEHYVLELRSRSRKKTLSRETYEILIEAYGKAKMIEQMEKVIHEMKSCGLQPSTNVYSSVLNTCVYKTRDHKQAVQLFDLMKFLAGNMAPGLIQYQDIIVSCVNNNDIERALDLYEELVTRKIPVNQKILVALARGCMTRELLKIKAWDFIFQIYEQNWEPTVPTLEYMVYLAAKDGDLALSRALYQNLSLLNSVSSRAFSFLMLAYARSSIPDGSQPYKVPSILVHESGRNFRHNIIEKTDYSPCLSSPKQATPFLPMTTISSPSEYLSESSAIMAHALLVNQEIISGESVNIFLDSAAKLGSKEEFLDRYNNFTYFDNVGVPVTRVAESLYLEESYNCETKDEGSAKVQANFHEKNLEHHTKSPMLDSNKTQCKLRFPRTTRTYIIALKSAAKNMDYELSQAIWQERGRHRKSTYFRSLSALERTDSDFAFAAAMVNCLTKLKLLDDALAILVSTEYQFRWTWRELRILHDAAVNVGYDKVSKTVRGIAQRAQEKYEGKIRKKDFKLYSLGRK